MPKDSVYFSGIAEEFDANPYLGENFTPWSWPSDSQRILRNFLVPSLVLDPKHRGLDIALEEGNQLRSPSSGIVRFSGFVVDRYLLTIDHGKGLISTFEPIETQLLAGDTVARGQIIGQLPAQGEPKHCAVSCFHFGVRKNGKYLNPLLLLGALPRSVLYPVESPYFRY
ncbi:MAG: peptidoglycan DD-metalloendopeptidase family protein [Microbacteriaceae bacterium]